MDQPNVDRPNVVIIVSDDQGYGDLSCMGATDFAVTDSSGLKVYDNPNNPAIGDT